MVTASFLNGATAMACLAIAAFFSRFWRESEDRLFLCLGIAFAVFAINYAVLGVLPFLDERRSYAFVLRLAGFVAMLLGLALKDRELAEHVTDRSEPV
jgi:uncharacterized protein (TIGR04206 family)